MWRERWRVVRRELGRLILLTAGALIGSAAYTMFQLPYNIVAGGLSGVAIIVSHFLPHVPVGGMYWVMNIPMLMIGFYYLGRWPFLWRTLLSVTLFSLFIDLLTNNFPGLVLTQDILLSTIYGGILGGIGEGLLFRAGCTSGGTAIIGRVVQQKTGLPLSQVYLYTDGAIILAAALLLGWEIGLYGLLLLFISGMASDYVLEGASNTRIITIVTNKPKEVMEGLIQTLGRGATYWEAVGAYTGQTRYVVYCTVYRSQVNEAQDVVAQIDHDAFVTVGIGQQALGEGFVPLKKK